MTVAAAWGIAWAMTGVGAVTGLIVAVAIVAAWNIFVVPRIVRAP